MSPKYRGDSEDWLDDEAKSAKSGRRPAAPKTGITIADALANATVAEVFPKQCRVVLDVGDEPVDCQYRRAAVFGEKNERAPVAVGDRVKVEAIGPGEGRIDGLCARTNRIVRPAPDRDEGMVHVIAANVDVLVVVASAADPVFSPGLVDRFLVAARSQEIETLLCISKLDLAVGARPWDLYRSLGVPVAEVSVRGGKGIAELRERLTGRTIVFCGHSGVGKTSLLTELLGERAGAVGDVSTVTGKGRHTTTSAVLLGGPGTSRWIDTPGVRAFGLYGVEAKNLAGLFPEFGTLACAQAGCLHAGEARCVATELPRYESYLRIYESLLAGEG